MEELLINLTGIIRMFFIFLTVFCLLIMLMIGRFNDELYDIKNTLVEIKKLLKEHFEKEN